MISVVMPFWRRQAVLDLNLATYRRLYPHDDIEIIIADDGSPEPAEIRSEFPWPVRIVRLPAKTMALNPCTAFNAAVSASGGDVLLLTNPEVVHRAPILQAMSGELVTLGRKGYVAAACWGAKAGWWYCHSGLMPPEADVGRAKIPAGAGLHFCAMLFRSLYDEVGGFSEEYRQGAGYEDNDLLWKLHAADARFSIFDDCVTDHHHCPPSRWPENGAARNRAIFDARWNA